MAVRKACKDGYIACWVDAWMDFVFTYLAGVVYDVWCPIGF
jgi:hypothetical protein